jgi:hypothetical protein
MPPKKKSDSSEVTIKAKTLFDHLSGLKESKVKWETLSEGDKKSFSVYLANRWLSMNPEYIDLVNEVQRFTNGQLGAREVYKVYYDFLPKKKTFDKYIKKSGGSVVSEQIISYICKYFEVSGREAEDYVELLSEVEVRDIIKKYGVKDSEIDKMYKDAAK